ncbi:CD209 antigen-like protein E [Pungitius pungitius]|uniref:CD209 antigen-like protein E n=1 Tax=Pungitius pungitius TaxID=134920 RepID=UPI002E12FD25
MEEIYANVEYNKSQVSIRPSTPGPRSPRSRPHGTVAVSLGLLSVLLLAGLVGLGVHLHASAAELSSIKANLTERLQVSGDKLSSVSAERDQLKDNFTALMDNFTALMDNFTALTQEKDRLQLLLEQKKTCPEGWRMFTGSCYFISSRDDSWTNARKDCKAKGADLVIIDSPQEQKSLLLLETDRAWIGLSETSKNNWKWIDGTPLTVAYWGGPPEVVQPDDYGGKEDCVEIIFRWNENKNWNDRQCSNPLKWICEKLV